MKGERYSALRTNGLLFLSGFAFMSALAGLGALIGPEPAHGRSEPVATITAEADVASLEALAAELAERERY